MTESSTLVQALLALVVIIAVAQVLGALAQRLGQPRVMGDILGGWPWDKACLGVCCPRRLAG